MGEGHRFCPLRCSQLGKEQTFLGMLEDLAGKRKEKKKYTAEKLRIKGLVLLLVKNQYHPSCHTVYWVLFSRNFSCSQIDRRSLQIPHLYIFPVYVYEFLYSPLSWDYPRHISQTFSLSSFWFSPLTRHWSQKDEDRSNLQHISSLDLLSSLGQGPPRCLVFIQHLHHWCPSQCLDAIMTQITTLFRTGVLLQTKETIQEA